jgi:NADPH:quinone reductase-like Zn-dependent oxidoreductase
MRAALHERYGPPETLRIADVPTPEPTSDQILVRVVASTVNRTDCGFLRAKPFVTRFFSGLTAPRHTALGCEFAGTVEQTGAAVSRFAVGERVFGFDDSGWGGHGEFKVIGQGKAVATIPDGVSFEQAAAATEGSHYALCDIRAAGVRPGDRTLVHGATGAIGSAAVQLLKHQGAYVVATSTSKNVDLVQSLGADEVIDHEREDFTACGQQFDLVFDTVGKSSFGACKPLLAPHGTYVSTELGPYGQNPVLALVGPVARRAGGRSVRFPIPRATQADVEFLADRLGSGDFSPVIDRSYPLADIVEAFHYVETGQKTGNVILTIAEPTDPSPTT